MSAIERCRTAALGGHVRACENCDHTVGLDQHVAALWSRSTRPEGPRRRSFGHWKTTTFLAGLRHDQITAPCVFDGPINGQRFLAWAAQALAPTLKPGDIVVMDNLSAHKVAGVRQNIEAKGAKIAYLPPYSPDFNP